MPNCFAVSEAHDGAAAGFNVVFGIIMGTGIGGGLAIAGRAHDGANDIAGEWGHTPLRHDGPPCYCGRTGCVEALLSGPALALQYQAAGGTPGTHARDATWVAQRALAGEPLAKQVLDTYLQNFGRALGTLINILDPDAIVLGGGLSNMDCLYDAGRNYIMPHVFSDELRTPIFTGPARRRQWRPRRCVLVIDGLRVLFVQPGALCTPWPNPLSDRQVPMRTAFFTSFIDAVAARGLSLYPAQEEAILEIVAGKNVILNTPTGSGKSLVALAMHYKGWAEQKRSFYTCPIKALVSEKFFSLCQDFGAENVGMLTGDASINRDAPIICCTAEILSNMALAEGAQAPCDYVIMDEFHYYSDKDRGAAWQIPLLTLPQSTFLLMSATMGDCQPVEYSLRHNTGREVAVVRTQERPVPLDFTYRETPLHETLADLIKARQYPVYVVNFTQRETVEEAQNVLSVDFCSKEEKQAIAQELADFRFDSPFGKDMRRFVSHGVGLHHAGLLPKYRLLVEKLAQEGRLKIIMGTDTLGVGVNIPIRTVLFTKLCKFDGEKTGILTVRDFKQIAGRAGRKGFDDQGSVVCQAPEHVIENKRMENRADPAKKKKLVKKKPPTKNYVAWDAKTFQRLIDDAPEPLQSRFAVTHSMVLNLLQSDSDGGRSGYRRLVQLIGACHDTPAQKSRHRKHAAVLFKSLRHAGIISVVRNRIKGNRVTVNEALQQDFSVNQTLSLYLLDTLPYIDPAAPTYGLDVLTLVESILENPHVVLNKQVDHARDIRMIELKAEGMEFEQRIEELDKVEYPKPNRDFIYETFNAYADKHPWVGSENIHPKSIAREMYETCASFHEYIRDYALQRSEGVLLRYLSQVYKALLQNVPESRKDESIEEIEMYLRTMLGRVDSSLVEEWEDMLHPSTDVAAPAYQPKTVRPLWHPSTNPRAFAARLRTEMHRLVKALATRDYDEATLIVAPSSSAAPSSSPSSDDVWTAERFAKALAPFHTEYGAIVFTPVARQTIHTHIKQVDTDLWQVQQTLLDPQDDNFWVVEGLVDLSDPTVGKDGPLVQVQRIGP